MIQIEQQLEKQKRLSKQQTDQERWVSGVIYSDSNRPDSLQMLLVKSAALTMRLAPKSGILYFEKPGQTHAFKIAAARGDSATVCPVYNVKVISGSERHALFEINCLPFEYKPNRVEMSAEIYIYDALTATAKLVWEAEAGKGDNFPFPKPLPSVKVEKNGYVFQWTGVLPNNKSGEFVTLHTQHTVALDPDSGKNYLQCRDLTVPKNEQFESGACQGRIVYALPSTKK